MSALHLADGPAMYFGGTIMTFALPYGAFIAASIVLFYLFRARHSGPRLRWSAGRAAQVASVTTREPAPAPGAAAGPAAAVAPEAVVPATPAPATAAADGSPADDIPANDTEGKDGEPG